MRAVMAEVADLSRKPVSRHRTQGKRARRAPFEPNRGQAQGSPILAAERSRPSADGLRGEGNDSQECSGGPLVGGGKGIIAPANATLDDAAYRAKLYEEYGDFDFSARRLYLR